MTDRTAPDRPSAGRRVIFLDLDGVLNGQAWIVREFKAEGRLPDWEFDPDNVAALRRLDRADDGRRRARRGDARRARRDGGRTMSAFSHDEHDWDVTNDVLERWERGRRAAAEEEVP